MDKPSPSSTSVAPNTPVIVGIGFHQERNDDPTQCSEAYQLMVRAIRNAADDALSSLVARHSSLVGKGPASHEQQATSNDLLGQLESISVLQGMWQYRNPGKLVAEALGCPQARSIVSDLGVLQLTPFDDLCRAIAAGEQDLGVVTGGEAQYRALRAMITQQPAPDTEQPESTPRPEVHLGSQDPFCSDLEGRRGLNMPAEHFAIIESALRHAKGMSIEQHRNHVAELYSSFSEVAAANPHAWRREAVSAADIRDASPKNPMLAFPYTKRHCSQWNVNHGVAILVCSARKAEELDLDPAAWIFPVAAVESRHVVVLAQQRRLHSHLGTVLCGERALALANATAEDVSAAELYSCFPAAIQSFAYDLKLEDVCPLTVTGSMAFSGGPFNHFSIEGLARMVEVLRSGDSARRRIGMVSNLSGIFGKQGCVVLSNLPGAGGYRYEDITSTVAEKDRPLPLNEDYAGPATIVGYTVVFSRENPSHAIAICDTPAGERTVARCEVPALLELMTREEFCGRVIEVESDGRFSG